MLFITEAYIFVTGPLKVFLCSIKAYLFIGGPIGTSNSFNH